MKIEHSKSVRSEGKHDLWLRLAAIEDADLLLTWRNRPDIVAAGLSNRRVEKAEHIAWFTRSLQSDEIRIWIAMLGELPIGQIRVEPGVEGEKLISVFILPDYSGNGYGVEVIKKACRQAFYIWIDLTTISAVVLENNDRSLRAFGRAGFHEIKTDSLVSNDSHSVNLVRCRPELVPHNRLTYGDAEVNAVATVISSGRWAGGATLAEFEERLGEWASVKYAVCVGSGLSALRLSLRALGIARGHRVAVPEYSCVALPNAVLSNQATPISIDVQRDTWNIDFSKMDSTSKSELDCIIAVNTFGCPADPQESQRDIPMIEDWAHGFRLAADGVSPAGLIGEIAIQSFYATKMMGVGEGGAVLTNSEGVAEFIRTWRDYGDQSPHEGRLNDKMTDIAAALGISQLRRLPQMIRRRRELAEIYTEAFSSVSWLSEYIRLPLDRVDRVWYRYPIFFQKWTAPEIIPYLRGAGVMADMPIYRWSPAHPTPKNIADEAFSKIVSLPLFPTLTNEEQERVIDAFVTACADRIRKNEE
jgi:perosamine synthetase